MRQTSQRRPFVAGGFWWWFAAASLSELAAALAFGRSVWSPALDSEAIVASALWLLGSVLVTVGMGRRLDLRHREVWEVAEFDELTGVSRRGPLVAALRARLARPADGVSALFMVDLDQFRRLNDAVGHGAADEFLRVLAQRIRDAGADSDAVGRMGDDDFAVLLTRPTREAIAEAAQQIVDSVGKPCLIGDLRATVTASVGVAVLEGVAAEDVLRRGSLALQAAKRAGGDSVRWFSPDLEAAAHEAGLWQVRLAAAIRDESFDNAFQLIVHAETGAPVGAEALVRLVTSDGDVVAGAFVEHAEATGQVIAMGRIARRRLAQQIPAIFEVAPPSFQLHVNLSVKELDDRESVAQFREPSLRDHADRLVIEVTESFELSASHEAKAQLRHLLELGYHIAIDDFGSGFSNFVQLEEFGFEIIKVDRTLLNRASSGNASSLAVLHAAVAVARSLGTRLVAEGVESDVQARLARELGFECLQGYGVALPMPLPQLLRRLTRGSVPA